MNRAQPRIGLSLKVAQKQILTPGLVQMVKLLTLNKLELRDMINEEMVANPLLEEMPEAVPSLDDVQSRREAETPDASAPVNGDGAAADRRDAFQEVDYGSFFQDYLDPGFKSPAAEDVDRPSFENFLSRPASLADHLQWQLSLSVADDAVRDAAISIIGNLNEDGYLTATLEEVAQAGGHKPEDVEAALALVQEFDPLGVAARNVRECLLIQLRVLAPENDLAQRIVADHLNNVQDRRFREIANALGKTVQDVEAALEFIRRLDPRPGQRYNDTQPRLIEPDVAFVKVDDVYRVVMNEDGLPHLRLSHQYRRMMSDASATREVKNYVRERFNSALQLIKNIEQRKQTIVRVCESIVRRQVEFLDKGLDFLRPMMIKDVAEEVGVHPSTVSRAVAGKYAHTPQGVFELRYFFSEPVQGPAGGNVSLINLKRLVQRIIEGEDSARPLTDEQITALLRERGISVTRRTVAKYREDLKIPSTHQRRRRT
jgi:RNA polymerase sigma-54 factor